MTFNAILHDAADRRAMLRAAPTRDFGYGVTSHYIHRDRLKPMGELGKYIWRP